ncbi:putative reverse transcriptase domain-containing protein [Tanacetum coccineum]|uniref:Reverse transcriptase domain-containing protein n=1 Tax=Tanacetum coccineum TaxID=301880 RepID=A0ABQ4ZD27_9ASTR
MKAKSGLGGLNHAHYGHNNPIAFNESEPSDVEYKEIGEVDIETLSMEQYLALDRGDTMRGVKKLEIGGYVDFEIKGRAKSWLERAPIETINTWDLLKRIFILRFYPPSKTSKQLEEIHNFRQEWRGTLYRAMER